MARGLSLTLLWASEALEISEVLRSDKKPYCAPEAQSKVRDEPLPTSYFTFLL